MSVTFIVALSLVTLLYHLFFVIVLLISCNVFTVYCTVVLCIYIFVHVVQKTSLD